MVENNYTEDWTTKEVKLQIYIGLIEEGKLPWIKKAKDLLDIFPKYKKEFDKAVRAGKEKQLRQYIHKIEGGETWLIEDAKELLKEFPKYGSELEKAIRASKEKKN